MPWTKEQVRQHVEPHQYRLEAIHNILRETAAISAAVDALRSAPQTVWFSQGFNPEQVEARKRIIGAAEAIARTHFYEQVALFLNKIEVPAPNAPTS
jgi:hypothetical protein